MNIRRLERRFGVIAVEKGFVTVDQIIEALKTQVMDDLDNKPHMLIGEILVEKGFLTPSQVSEVLKEMGISPF